MDAVQRSRGNSSVRRWTRSMARKFYTNMHADILLQIFLALVKDTEFLELGYYRYWDWVCVTEVCRHWRSVAAENPCLWSYIRDFRSESRTKRFLLMSRNSDLTVDYVENSLYVFQRNSFSNLKMVLKEMRRIRYLRIDIMQYGFAGVHRLLEQSAPRARSMTLKLPDYRGQTHFLMPTTSPGVLKKVWLQGMSLRQNLTRLSGLSTLRIQSCERFPLPELLRVLSSSPELVELHIRYCDISDSHLVEEMNIPLPSLLVLELGIDNFSACISLLQCIRAPNLLRWEVRCGNTLNLDGVSKLGVAITILLQRQLPCEKMTIAVIYCADTLMVDVYIIESLKELDIPVRRAKLHVSVSRQLDLDITLSLIRDSFRWEIQEAQCIDVSFPDDFVGKQTWYNMFCMAKSAKSLQVMIPPTCNDSAHLEALGNIDSSHLSTPGEIPCPKLENIHVIWFGHTTDVSDLDCFLLCLEDLVKARSRNGIPVRKLSVFSYNTIRNDSKFEELSEWVKDREWNTRKDL